MMSPFATAAVLAGAALHAGWNVGIRGQADRRLSTAWVAFGAAVVGAVVLQWLPAIAPAAWPHVLLSMVLHTIYFNLLAEAYVRGAVGLVYPVMRGVAPALVALVVTVGFGERLGVVGWAGLLLISVGVGLQARWRGGAGEGRAVGLALGNAVIIACYTINDGFGARVSHAPVSYAVWTFVVTGVPATVILLRGNVVRLVRGNWPDGAMRGLGGGACSVVSYGLALWSMTRAPIAAVAALRETAMLFAVLFAWWFLRERPRGRGLVAIGLIAAGAVFVRLG